MVNIINKIYLYLYTFSYLSSLFHQPVWTLANFNFSIGKLGLETIGVLRLSEIVSAKASSVVGISDLGKIYLKYIFI